MNDGSEHLDPGNAALDDIAREWLVSRKPVIVRRRVNWGECDPAKVVYTPRFADYLVAAYGWFTRVVLADALALDDGKRFSTPMKALSLEFHHVLRPDELFDMTVKILSVRKRTFDLVISANSPDGNPHFTGQISPIFVNSENFQSVAIPPHARDALLAYAQAFPA